MDAPKRWSLWRMPSQIMSDDLIVALGDNGDGSLLAGKSARRAKIGASLTTTIWTRKRAAI